MYCKFSKIGAVKQQETLAAIIKLRNEEGVDFPDVDKINEYLSHIQPDSVYRRLEKLVKLRFLKKEGRGEYSLNSECFITTKESAKFILFFLQLKKEHKTDFIVDTILVREARKSNIFSSFTKRKEINNTLNESLKSEYLKRHRFRKRQIMSGKLLKNHLKYLQLIVD